MTDGGLPADEGAGIRETLRRHLRERMVARDKPAVQAIRAVVAAIENAEAQPIDGSSASEQLLNASTSADVARRLVSDEDARDLVAGEIDELHAAALHRPRSARPNRPPPSNGRPISCAGS